MSRPSTPDRLNVLLAPNVYVPLAGGVPVAVRQLARGLVARGHQVTIATAELWPGQTAVEPIDGVDVHRLPCILPRRVLWEQHTHGFAGCLRQGPADVRRLARLIATRRIDVINLHSVTNGVAAYLLVARLFEHRPLVVTLQGYEFFGLKAERRMFRRVLLRSILHRASCVTAVSAVLAEEVRRFAPRTAGRTVVIPNSVVAGDFARPPPAASPRYVLAIARLSRPKGLDVLLAAFRRVSDQDAQMRLVIAGDGPERVRLRALCLALGLTDRVAFTGEVCRERIGALLAGCELLVLPSWNEGQPIAVLEAMASGKAVVATRVCGVPEIVVHGETGLLVPPGDPESLADAMVAILRDPGRRRAMGQAGRAFVRAHHDSERTVDRYVQVFQDAVRGLRPATAATPTA